MEGGGSRGRQASWRTDHPAGGWSERARGIPGPKPRPMWLECLPARRRWGRSWWGYRFTPRERLPEFPDESQFLLANAHSIHSPFAWLPFWACQILQCLIAFGFWASLTRHERGSLNFSRRGAGRFFDRVKLTIPSPLRNPRFIRADPWLIQSPRVRTHSPSLFPHPLLPEALPVLLLLRRSRITK